MIFQQNQISKKSRELDSLKSSELEKVLKFNRHTLNISASALNHSMSSGDIGIGLAVSDTLKELSNIVYPNLPFEILRQSFHSDGDDTKRTKMWRKATILSILEISDLIGKYSDHAQRVCESISKSQDNDFISKEMMRKRIQIATLLNLIDNEARIVSSDEVSTVKEQEKNSGE